MAGPAPGAHDELDAGVFSAWVEEVGLAIRGDGDADVACGTCTACCTASQFVHVGPEEDDALAHIPAELLFPAPGAPAGHVLMGYDEHGRCPMLGDDGCSIYEHRPRTCRSYDCRVFAATGVEVDADTDDDTKVLIGERARRWRFQHPTDDDVRAHEAAEAAAAFLLARASELPADDRPRTTTQRAVLAVELHRLFLDGEPAPAVHAVVQQLHG